MNAILANKVKNLDDYSWTRNPVRSLHKKLEEKLLNSECSIENPFAPLEDAKTKSIEKMPIPKENA